MIRKFKIWLCSILIIGITVNLGMYIYVKIAQYRARALFGQVKNHDKVYVYETYFGALNAVMYVVDLKDTSALIDYYAKVEKHDTSAVINFEINFMRLTLHEPIYVSKYFNKGSNIMQIVDFDNHCWGYVEGYIYKPTSHISAPPDSLIKQYEEFVLRRNATKEVQRINRIGKKINPYGFYCDN